MPETALIKYEWTSGVAPADPSKLITRDASLLADELVCRAEEITQVTNEEERVTAMDALADIKAYSKQIAVQHKAQKEPFLVISKQLDEAKNKALALVENSQASLDALLTAYAADQLKRQRAAEKARQEEAARIRKEQEAQLEAAKKAREEHEYLERQRAAEEARIRLERIQAEERRVKEEREKEVAEARRIADEAARKKAEEEAMAEIARKETWDNSIEGKEAARLAREELDRQRQEAEELGRQQAIVIAAEMEARGGAGIALQERLAAEEARLEQERQSALAAEQQRQQEAALETSVIEERIEQATQAPEKIKGVATHWTFRFFGETEDDQKLNMIRMAQEHPGLFDIQPISRTLNTIARGTRAEAHVYQTWLQFVGEISVRAMK